MLLVPYSSLEAGGAALADETSSMLSVCSLKGSSGAPEKERSGIASRGPHDKAGRGLKPLVFSYLSDFERTPFLTRKSARSSGSMSTSENSSGRVVVTKI